MGTLSDRNKVHAVMPFVVAAVTLTTFYWLTAPGTITWWEGSSWPLTAATLGVTAPPGSLILTLLGWLVTQIPLGVSTALKLNLFAGLISVVMLGILYTIILNIRQRLCGNQIDRGGLDFTEAIAIGSSLLTLGLSFTIWRYGIKITPYILTGLLTAALIWAMLSWWKEAENTSAVRWLFMVCLLFGLDFSAHRTNLLIFPGFITLVLLRYPLTFTRGRNWMAAAMGLLLGLSLHLLLIPLAAQEPAINIGDPSTLSRFYDYVSLKQFGGRWLVNLLPRKGPFLEHQLADYLRAFVACFSNTSGKLGLIGILPLVSGLYGMTVIWRAQRRLAIALLILFLLTSLGAVVYFNLPAKFPWPMDRHYIPSFLIFGLFMTIGAVAIVRLIAGSIVRLKKLILIIVIVMMFGMPAAQLTSNFCAVDASNDRFAYDYVQNIFVTIEPKAILFVQGDDIWPFWYLRLVERIRPDVSIISPSLMNTTWYVKQITNQSPQLPISLTDDEFENISIIAWPKDTVVTITGDTKSREESLLGSEELPDSVNLHLPASIANQYLLAQDWLLLRMIIENRWQRPIYFTEVPDWLRKHCRLEGLVSRLMPVDSATINCQLLYRNLMESYVYTGYADHVGQHDWITQTVREKYISCFLTLIECEKAYGDSANTALVSDRLKSVFPRHPDGPAH